MATTEQQLTLLNETVTDLVEQVLVTKASLDTAVASAEEDAITADQKATIATQQATLASGYAASALDSLNAANVIYASVEAGRTGSINNQLYRVVTGPGLQVWRRDDASNSTFIGWINEVIFNNVAELIASTFTSFPIGQIIRTRRDGAVYTSAASGATDHHLITAGGVKLYVVPLDGMMHVDWFGAKGDGTTNDVAAFQTAFQAIHALGGGVVAWGGLGKIYRIAYNAIYSGLVLGPNTTFERVGSGYILLDPSTLPSTQPASGISGRMKAYGEITCGDPVTMTRATPLSTVLDGFICTTGHGMTEANAFVKNVRIINADIRCNTAVDWSNPLDDNRRLYGIKLWWAYDSILENCRVEGTPNNGIQFAGGYRNRMINPTAIRCGFSGQLTTPKNGINVYGFMLVGNPELSSHTVTIENAFAQYCYDEGLAYACIKGLHITSYTCIGCKDRAIEGDNSFKTTATATTYGQEIPCDVTIDQVIFDGLYSDGITKAKVGVTLGDANQGRAIIGKMYIRNVASTFSVVSANFNNNGRVIINDIIIEDCSVPVNYAGIYVKAENVYIGNVRFINCTGTGNSAAIRIDDAKIARVENVDIDGGFIYGVQFNPTGGAIDFSVANIRARNLSRAVIALGGSGDVTFIDVMDCSGVAINTAGSTDAGFLLFTSNSLTADEVRLRRNRCRMDKISWYPVSNLGSVTVPTNAFKVLTIIDNDFDPLGHSMPFSERSFGATYAVQTIDRNNGIQGQRRLSGSAIPTTGSYSRGDIVDNRLPSAAGTTYWQCTTEGTFGTLTSITGSITSGTAALTVNDASGIIMNNWITIVGVSGRKRVIGKNGNVLTLDSNADATVAGAAIAFTAPVFKAVGLAT